MPCRTFSANGMTGFVCGPAPRRKKCACGSGRPAIFECDWKVPERKSGTCDALICSACSSSPEKGKDLCRLHTAAWIEWKKRKARP